MNPREHLLELEARLGCRPGKETTRVQYHTRAQWELEQWFELHAAHPHAAAGHLRAHLAYADLAREAVS